MSRGPGGSRRIQFGSRDANHERRSVLSYLAGRRIVGALVRRLMGMSGPWCEPEVQRLRGLVRRCQDEIEATAVHPHYAAVYRSEEASYWEHIPRWIAADLGRAAGPRRLRTLDVGCAYGTLSLFCQELLDSEAYCVDFVDHFMSEALRARRQLRYRRCNVELEPVPFEPPFDIIVLTEVLEHFNFHPVPTLAKLRALLAPRGRLYLSTPDALKWGRLTTFHSRFDAMPLPTPGRPVFDGHVYLYDREELFAIARRAGFVVERFEYACGTTHRHINASLRPARPQLLWRARDYTRHTLTRLVSGRLS
jgi:SAM-dependent methyltransferase